MSWAAAAGVGSDIFSQMYQEERQRSAAQQSRQWQERMSNTAMQRRVRDLRKAGLNPLLAVTRGAGPGATTGSGGQAQVSLGSPSGGMQKGAQTSLLVNSARKEKALAEQAETQSAIEAKKLQTYRDNPKLWDMMMKGELGKRAGAGVGQLITATDAASTAYEMAKKSVVKGAKGVYNWYDKRSKAYYDRKYKDKKIKKKRRKKPIRKQTIGQWYEKNKPPASYFKER